MKWILLVSAVALAGQVAARAGAGADRADTSGGVVTLPSAAGRSEAIPGVVVTLPAPPRRLPRPRPSLRRSPPPPSRRFLPPATTTHRSCGGPRAFIPSASTAIAPSSAKP